MEKNLFICFAAEDRYRIVEPVVFHLKNYGINMWYDRYTLIMGDNRIQKNLIEGASTCKYAVIIISEFTSLSHCAMEELSIIRERHYKGDVTIFPIIYELSIDKIPTTLTWIKELIFKEANRHSGTYEICNHIACKITGDVLQKYEYQNIRNITTYLSNELPMATYRILMDYQGIDSSNLNSKVSMLYAAHITIKVLMTPSKDPLLAMLFSIFERLFCETKLNLSVDYRELWLLENSMCILANQYINYCTESKI